jgi:putative hydrolases of HD superfamily
VRACKDSYSQKFTDYHDRGESISDHMYRMSLITLFAPASLSSRINIPHCMKMALVHDMAEALVGDITPVDGVTKVEKSRRESTTMDYFTDNLLGKVNGGMTGKELKDIWREYEDGDTLESKFVHDVDKIELVLQMLEYEKARNGKLDLGEFSWVASRIQLPEVRAWSDEVMREREEFWAKTGGQHTTFTPEKKPDTTQITQHNEYYGNGTA